MMNPNAPQPNEQPEVPVTPANDTPVTPEAGSSATPVVEQPTAFSASEPTPTPISTPTSAPEITPTPEATPVANPFGSTPDATVVPPVGVSPSPAPKDKKKIILLAGIIGGVVLLALIAVLVYVSATSVSKQDYADAAKQYNAVNSANSELTSEVSSLSRNSSATDASFDESAKSVEDAIATLKTENDEFGKLKAVSVGEGKKVYDTFDKKLEAYLGYANELLASVKNVRPALVVCDAVGDASDNAARVAALKACSEALGKTGDLPNPQFKTFVDTIKTEYASYATTYESIAALTSPFGAQYDQYKTLRDQMYDTQDNIRTASTNFSKAIKDRDEEMSVKDSADALRTFLNEQQRK